MSCHHNDRDSVKYTQYLHLTAALLCTIGRWWCNISAADLEKLQALRLDLRPKTGLNQMTDRNRGMLRQFDDRALALRALLLPEAVIAEYRHREGFNNGEACRIQRATMVALQLATALRPKNLVGLRIGIHLLERGGKFYVHIPASEVKNGVELEFVLPDRTATILRFYLANVRPLLLNGDSDYVWPGRRNKRPMTTSYVGGLIGNFMEAEVGVRVTAHRFRHLAGYLYLLDNPNGYEVVRLLLGHKSLKTTMTFYASLEAKEGFKRYDAAIERRLRELKKLKDSDDNGGNYA